MRRTVRTLVLGLAVALLVPASALANEPREHDGGFFVRLSGGPGYATTSIEEDVELTFKGPSFDFNVAVGYGFGSGFIVHFTGFGWSVFEPEVEFDGVESDTEDVTMTMAAGGIGVTYYVQPANFYLTGSVGAGSLTLDVDDLGSFESDPGLALDVAVGKEWWVANRWGLGVAAGLNYHSIEPDETGFSDEKFSGVGFGLRFTATYN